MADRSKLVKSGAYRWEEIPLRAYRDNEVVQGVTRQVLMGAGDDEDAIPFVVRYFEVATGGATRCERHPHLHVVVVLRGTGEVLLAGARSAIEPHDVVYVAPNDEHQFVATGGEPLGFLCIVGRRRAEEGGR